MKYAVHKFITRLVNGKYPRYNHLCEAPIRIDKDGTVLCCKYKNTWKGVTCKKCLKFKRKTKS